MANTIRKKAKERSTPATGKRSAQAEGGRKTYVALVLDSSGSMQSVKSDAIGGFNTTADSIRQNAKLGGETYVSLFTFGEGPENLGNAVADFDWATMWKPQVKYLNQPVERLEDLTEQTYRPMGSTPMLDGIGLALTSLQPFDVEGEDVAFLVTVITDGYENASQEWDGWKLGELVEKLQAKGNWTITLIGANVDLDQIKRMTGIQQAVGFVSTGVGTQQAFAAQAAATASYFATRGMGGQSVGTMYGGERNLSSAGSVARLQAKAAADLKNARWKLDPDEDDDNTL